MVSVGTSSASASGQSMQTDGTKNSAQQANYFMDSRKANIKEKYHFSSKLAQGGFGVVYLAEDRQTKEKFAVKAIQKRKLKDYTTFINEINILKVLVSEPVCQLLICDHVVGSSKHHQAG